MWKQCIVRGVFAGLVASISAATAGSATPQSDSLGHEMRVRQFNARRDKGRIDVSPLRSYLGGGTRRERYQLVADMARDKAVRRVLNRYVDEELGYLGVEPGQARLSSMRRTSRTRPDEPIDSTLVASFRRYYNGIGVMTPDASFSLEFDQHSGEVRRVWDVWEPLPSPPPGPVLNAEAAASAALQAADPPFDTVLRDSLMYQWLPGDEVVSLIWVIDTQTNGQGPFVRRRQFRVDAITGVASIVPPLYENATSKSDSLTLEERMRAFNAREDKGRLDLGALVPASKLIRQPGSTERSPALDAAQAEVRRYLTEYRDQLGMPPEQAVVTSVYIPIDVSWPTGPRIPLARYYHGIKFDVSGYAHGAQISFDAESGRVLKIVNRWLPIPEDTPTTPGVDSAQVARIAINHLGVDAAEIAWARLYYTYNDDHDLRLMWSVGVEPAGRSLQLVYVDAMTGIVDWSRESSYRWEAITQEYLHSAATRDIARRRRPA